MMNDLKKVLIFSTNYIPFVGGAEIAVREITSRISPDEYTFHLVAPRLSRSLAREEQVGHIHVVRVGFGLPIDKFLLPITGFFKALTLQRKNHYDLVWSIMASWASIAAGFFKLCYRRVPLLLTLQEGDEEEHLKRYVFGNDLLYRILVRPWHTLVFKKADAITAISNHLIKRAEEQGIDAPMYLVPNGVDLDLFSVRPSEAEVEYLKKELGIEGKRVIITTSRLVKKNAVEDIIRSFSYLPVDVVLLIAGVGPDEPSLKALARAKKAQDRVIFLGHIAYEKLPLYLALADVFVRPSLSEGMGNSFIEAMAAGVPVVATPVGGIPDFLTDGQTGLFCEVKNPESIAHQIMSILEDTSLRTSIAKQAREMIFERYSWNNIARQMREVFDTLIP